MKKHGSKKKTVGAKKRVAAKKKAAAGRGGEKKEGTVQEGDAALAGRLKSLTEGLSYQSESDYAVEPYARAAGDGAPSAEEFSNGGGGETAAVRELDFDSFFGNYTDAQDWWGDEERAAAAKFQALVEFMKENLSDVKVYRVGGVEADVYVVGRTASGGFAGVKTKVVET
ncbi:MAG TPA: nuclease A inhibitor family protein [Pyrinomonadaceae bacterium]|nr:nuclease A inhibitor family protein [Pyrinomonadaceae bacterium]